MGLPQDAEGQQRTAADFDHGAVFSMLLVMVAISGLAYLFAVRMF